MKGSTVWTERYDVSLTDPPWSYYGQQAKWGAPLPSSIPCLGTGDRLCVGHPEICQWHPPPAGKVAPETSDIR